MYYFFSKRIFLFAVFSCLLAEVSFALSKDAEDSTRVYTIREVRVTESYRNAEIRSSSPLQILSSKQIGNLNALQVSDAVKYFAGVAVKDYGGIGGLKTVSVRSLGAAHTAVSYDGISLSDTQTGQIDIGRFSLENVDMLSLSNGQSDNIFQPARLFASAAVLNIRTLTPRFEGANYIHARASLKGGSFGMINPSLWLQYKLSRKYALSFSSEWLSADGQYPYKLYHGGEGDSVSNEKRKNTDVKNLRLEAALHGSLSEKENGYIKAYYYHSERGLPGAIILYNTENFSSQRLSDATFFLQGHYQNILSEMFSIQGNAKFNHGYLHYLDPTYLNETGRQESFYRQNEYYLSLSALYKALPHLSFAVSSDGFINALGAEFESDSVTNEFPKPVRYNLLSVVAAKYVSEHVLATASLLSTLVKETVQKGSAGSNYNRLSPYVSVTYKPLQNSDLRFRAFYKNIFRLPTFNDLYYSRIGNIHLKPETTNQFDIGITYAVSLGKTIPLVSFTVDGYRNHVRDKIMAMPTKNIFVWSMVNLGKVRITGVDISGEASVSAGEKLTILFGGTYTYQRALDVTDPEGSTYLHQVPYMPRVSGSGRLSLETPWVNFAYSLLWSGKRYSTFQNFAVNRLASYSDHSLSVSKSFSLLNQKLNFKFEALNLLNENYMIVKWFPMPGRSFRGTLSWTF